MAASACVCLLLLLLSLVVTPFDFLCRRRTRRHSDAESREAYALASCVVDHPPAVCSVGGGQPCLGEGSTDRAAGGGVVNMGCERGAVAVGGRAYRVGGFRSG